MGPPIVPVPKKKFYISSFVLVLLIFIVAALAQEIAKLATKKIE